MNRKVISLLLIISFCVSGCSMGSGKKTIDFSEAQFSRMTRIFELETLECRYHNIAISKKSRDFNLIQKDVEFWVEYDSVATISYDISKSTCSIDKKNKVITVKLPKPKIVTKVIEDTISKKPIKSSSGLVKLDIKFEDIQKAVDNSEKDMKEKLKENNTLYGFAQTQAEMVISNFIDTINKVNNSNYEVIYEYASDEEKEESTEKK